MSRSSRQNYPRFGWLDAVAEFGRAGIARRRPVTQPLTVPAAVTPTTTATKVSGGGANLATVVSGGSGYAVNDEITLSGGSFVVSAILRVTAVSSGAVTTAAVVRAGVYTTVPSNAVAQASTTGAGTGATFNVTWNGSVASSIKDKTTGGATSSSIKLTGTGPSDSGTTFYSNSQDIGTACI